MSDMPHEQAEHTSSEAHDLQKEVTRLDKLVYGKARGGGGGGGGKHAASLRATSMDRFPSQ